MLLYQDFQDNLKDGRIIISRMTKKDSILSAVKTNDNGEPILNENRKTIHDAVSTLIFTIANHFIGDPSLWKDKSGELLSNPKCKSVSDFKWYKDTFLTRVFTREDSQQSFWKEKFLAELPKSLGDKDLQNEINILKKEIHLIKQQQQHQNCLSHILDEDSDNTEEEPQNDQNLQNQIFKNEEDDQIVQLSKDDQKDEIAEIFWSR
ncbi:hypothetical protein AHAS_Ahas14G0186100 [Arachis hypogaea]